MRDAFIANSVLKVIDKIPCKEISKFSNAGLRFFNATINRKNKISHAGILEFYDTNLLILLGMLANLAA